MSAKDGDGGRPPSRVTRLVHSGRPSGDRVTVNPPVERGSTVAFADAGELYAAGPRTYGRHGLATHAALKDALSAWHGAEHVTLTPSGLAACALSILPFVRSGDHVLITDSVYAPVRVLAQRRLKAMDVEAQFYDPRIAGDVASLIKPNTRLVYLESPGSLTFEIQDTPALCAAAKAAGAVSVMDDTWAGGWAQDPFAHGVDVVVQALTKHQGGHSDALMGAVMTNDADHAQTIADTARDLGNAVSPDDASLILRGMRTLDVRLERSAQTGRAVADWVADHPAVAEVLHPARADHPDHALWARDFTGAPGLFGVRLRPVEEASLTTALNALTLFGMGFSWGGYESLVIPCGPQLRRTASPDAPDGPLVRISTGLEDAADLIADLDQAFARLSPVSASPPTGIA